MNYTNYQPVPVYSLDEYPLSPCHPARARKLLARDRAVIYHVRGVFGIKLVDKMRSECKVQEVTLNIDPGSQTSGFAIVVDNDRDQRQVLGAYELKHRTKSIKMGLLHRRQHRKSRRSRLRHREPRFNNRRRMIGSLRPSVQGIVDSTMRVVDLMRRVYPIARISIERNKFDTQLMRNPNIRGAEYQHGTLHGWQLRAYLFDRDDNRCVYCGSSNHLELDHVQPRAHGGSNRVDNLVVCCHSCNQAKADQSIKMFLRNKPELLEQITRRLYRSDLASVAHINTAMPSLVRALEKIGLDVEFADAATVAWNRRRLDIPKAHCYDAALHGSASIDISSLPSKVVQVVLASGQSKQKSITDQNGTPRGKPFREQQRLPKYLRQCDPAAGHRSRQQRYGPQNIGTGDIIRLEHHGQIFVGRAVIKQYGTRIAIGTHNVVIANCRLIARDSRCRIQLLPIKTRFVFEGRSA